MSPVDPSRAMARARRLLSRAARDQAGATAAEFGMVALPFFLFIFGIMGVTCLGNFGPRIIGDATL